MAIKPPARKTPAKKAASSARGATKVRHIRARDAVYNPAAERAEREGFGIAEVTRRFWHEYGKGGATP